MPTITALHPLQRLGRLLNAERRDIGYIYFYAILSGIISLSLPLGVQAIINYVQTAQVSTSWVVLVAVVTAGVIIQGVLQVTQLSISETIQQRIFTNSAFEFAYRIPRMDLDATHNHYAPELVNRFFDTLTLQKGMSKIVLDLSASSLQIVFGLILLSLYHPFFIIFGLILIAVLTVVIRYTSPSGLRTSLTESKYKFAVAHWLEEMARSVELFKISGNPRYPMARTDMLTQNYLTARKLHFKILVSKFSFLIGFKVLIIAALLVLGSLLVINGQMNIGQFVAVEIVIILLLNSVEKLILSVETVYDVLTAVDKIGFVTDIPLEREDGISLPDAEQGHAIEVRSLSFTLPGGLHPVVQAQELKLSPGEKICITGDDEVAKTAFLRLLAGFYDDFDGLIAYQGVPIQNLHLRNLRRSIGAFGDTRDVFDASLRDNITLGDDAVPVERLVQILELTGLSSFVQSLPEGLEYRITPEPEKVPEVILRKIVIARALLRPKRLILLMDPVQGFSPSDRQRILDHLLGMPDTTVIITTDEDAVAGRFPKAYQLKAGKLTPNKEGR